MVITRFLACHKERFSIFKEGPIVGNVDVILVFFIVKHCGLASFSVCGKNLEMILMTVKSLDSEHISIFSPFHSWKIDIGFLAGVHLLCSIVFEIINIDLNHRVILACLRIFEAIPFRIKALEFLHLELSHLRLVEFVECYLLAVR